MDKRYFLKTVSAGTIASVFSQIPSSVFAQTGALKGVHFGVPNPMSGAFAANGIFAEMGMRMAIDEYKGRFSTAPTFTAIDTEGKPATAIRRVQELYDSKAARFFVGGILSSEAIAMGAELNKRGAVYITTAGADEITGKECNRSTFRWSVPTYGAIEQTVRPLIKSMPNAKRWYTITPQYVFGEGLLSAAKNVFKQHGIQHVGNSYHSLAEKEFSGYLSNALSAKPDVLLILNFAAQSSDTLRQAVSFGLKNKMTILLAWASGLEQFEALGPKVCEGVYFGAQYWHAVNTPVNNALVQRSQKMFKRNPNYSMAGAYIGARMIFEAMLKAKSTDPAVVIKTLQGMKYDGLTGPEEVRAGDHQVLKNYYLLKGKPASAMKNKDDYVEIISAGKSFLPVEKTGCNLQKA